MRISGIKENIRKNFVQQGDTHRSQLQKKRANSLSQASQHLLQRDANVFLHQALSTPVMNVMESADGPYITDMDGNEYLDLHGNGVHNIGFNNKEVISAIIHQFTEQLTFTPRRYTSVPAVEFAEKLVGSAPEGLDRVLFCPGGSEAIEMAVALAKQVTGRYKTISFWNQYHGNTMQAATLSGNEHFTSGMGPVVPGALHVQYPNYFRNPWDLDASDYTKIDAFYLAQIQQVFDQNPDIAAVIGTTISSTPYVPSKNYWTQVRKLCDKYGALLIFDEIVCGLGRTGKLFACEHYVTPDVLVLGKSLGGGVLPFAGILTRDDFNTVSDHSIGHYTHEKSPICSVAGLATLRYMEEHDVARNAEFQGKYLLNNLIKIQQGFSFIGNVQGAGLLISIDLVKSRKTMERDEEKANEVLAFCLSNGLSFKIIDGNVLTLRPSLIIDQEHSDFILETLTRAFSFVGTLDNI